jgi:hypothetical protein
MKLVSKNKKNTDESMTMKEKAEVVFKFWQKVMGKSRARINKKRQKAITDRIKEGYVGEDFKDAILGCRKSDFHMGNNDRGKTYNDIELICRDGVNLEKFIEMNSEVVHCSESFGKLKTSTTSAAQIASDTSWAK